MDLGTITTFIVLSFSLALVLLLSRDKLAPQFKRGMAIIAIIMVSFSFFLVFYLLLTMGDG